MTDDMGSGYRLGADSAQGRPAPPPLPSLVHEGRGGLHAVIPTVGGELRIRTTGATCELQSWSRYADGAMMAGGLRLDAQTLRVALHMLKVALHHVERAEADTARRVAA